MSVSTRWAPTVVLNLRVQYERIGGRREVAKSRSKGRSLDVWPS